MPSKVTHYYYAGGKKIPLQRVDNLVALRGQVPSRKRDSKTLAMNKRDSMPLMDGLSLVDVQGIADEDLAKYASPGDMQPVYTAGNTLMVPLPEVSVEAVDEKKQKSLEKLLDKMGDLARVEKGKYGQITVHLTSGKGDDALQLANLIHEKIRPELAAARFMQVTSSPDVMRRSVP